MPVFSNILYVTAGLRDEVSFFKDALHLARVHRAKLAVLVLLPEFPRNLEAYEIPLQQAAVEKVKAAIGDACTEMDFCDPDALVSVRAESTTAPALSVVRRVLQENHDLVIKAAGDAGEGSQQLRALDMDLLRKCPCPVWLCLPLRQAGQRRRIAVAVDPQSGNAGGSALAGKLLRVADALASALDAELHVISCWDFPLEQYLRGNAWIKITEDELQHSVGGAHAAHLAALDSLLERNAVNATVTVHHLRGRPDDLIPRFAKDNSIDILLMGTVARPGIAGLLMGNTAENVLQKLDCTVVALKPDGFVSPLK